MESTQDIKSLLTGTPISTVIPSRPLVHLGHTASIGDVLELLSSHGILSAPVFTANAEGVVEKPGIGTLLGFVDVWAVLVAFLQSLPAGRWARVSWHNRRNVCGAVLLPGCCGWCSVSDITPKHRKGLCMLAPLAAVG